MTPAALIARFEAAQPPDVRRARGLHYTDADNILKALDPLLLSALRAAPPRQQLDRLSAVRVLDPACGAGSFLLVAYRALRAIEREALDRLGDPTVGHRLRLEQLLGIELDAEALGVAREALRLAARLEDDASPHPPAPPSEPALTCGNALRMAWPAPDGDLYVVGNPPFLGKKEQTLAQKADLAVACAGVPGAGKLDYVAGWFLKAAALIAQRPAVRCALVSTSSICQGEQVSVLWGALQQRGVEIHFAHRAFPWRADASVECVIIGFGRPNKAQKWLWTPQRQAVSRINAYLVDGPPVLLRPRAAPLSHAPPIRYGSFALDDGHYTLSEPQRDALLREAPESAPYIRPFIGGRELIRGTRRFCLWLADADPDTLREIPAIWRRVEAVRVWRSASRRASTARLAKTPARFAEIRQPTGDYLAVPTLSSVRRPYIPIGHLDRSVIASNQVYVFAEASLLAFGILTSAAHMAWVAAVSGRFKSDYRYSARIAYNNFPWPVPTASQRQVIEETAAHILSVRGTFAGRSLAALYDPDEMPATLRAAHAANDAAVSAALGLESGADVVAQLLAKHPDAG